MEKKNIVINLLEYADRVAKGESQVSLLDDVAATGVGGVEVRREYFKNFDAELDDVHKVATEKGLKIFYSVPEVLFIDGQFNSAILGYLEEGKRMGVTAIKFNIGDFANFKGDLKQALAPVVAAGIQVNVENDQTQASGTIQPLLDFLQAAKAADIDIKYVYDLGNWRFVGEDEFKAAGQLAPYVRYVHLKDVVLNDGKPDVVALDEGVLDWRKVMQVLPDGSPVAIEYPAADNEVVQTGVDLVATVD